MELELRHLRTICAIADSGSVTRAASTLGLSQPSLTAQLQRIEKRLGGTLFQRGRHGAAPTPLGEFVLAKARLVLPALTDLDREATRYTAQPEQTRPLRYGAVPGPLMAGLIRHLAERSVAPVSLRTESSSRTLADLVAQGNLELAALLEFVDHPVPPDPRLERRIVATEPAFALVSAASPLAKHDEVDLAMLADESFVLPPLDDNGLRETLAAACSRAGFRPRLGHEADASGARDLIAAGQGVGIGQATFHATPGIVACGIAGSPLRLRHVLTWAREGPVGAIADEVEAAAREAYADRVRRSRGYRRWLERHPDAAEPGAFGKQSDRLPTYDLRS